MQLAVSLNGQQFHTLPFRYRWLTPPLNGSISGLPTSGPVEGGTLVTMSGPGLAGGDDYRCRFGGGRGGGRWSAGDEGGETRATAAAAEAMGAVAAATYDAAAGALPLPLTLACRSLTVGALAPTLNPSPDSNPRYASVRVAGGRVGRGGGASRGVTQRQAFPRGVRLPVLWRRRAERGLALERPRRWRHGARAQRCQDTR